MRLGEFPLLKRELVGLLRTKRSFWILVSTVGISSLVLLLSWPSFWDSVPQDPYRNAARFYTFIVTQLIVMLLFTPAFTSPAFTAEREERTFEMLYSTLLSPASIVVSKLLSSVGYLLVLLAASAPVVSTLYLLGGFAFGTIAISYTITLAALVSSSLVCLTVSLRSKSTAQAMVRSFVWILVWNGGLGLLVWLVLVAAHEAGMRMASGDLAILLALSPFSALAATWQSYMEVSWLLYIGYAGLVAGGHLVYLLGKTRNPYAVFQTRAPQGRRAAYLRRRERAGTRRSLLCRFLVALGDRETPGFTNPVFQKEIRSEFFSRLLYRRLVFWTSALLYALLVVAFQSAWNSAWLHAVASVNLFLVLVLVPAVAATSVTREREKENLDFLRSSLLSQGAILRGKFLSSIYSNFGLIAAMAWTSGIAVLGSSGSGRRATLGVVVLVVAMTLLTATFVAALSLLASVRSRRSVGALLLSYGALLLICVGLPIFFELTDLVDLNDGFGMATHPFIALNAAIEHFSRTSGSIPDEMEMNLMLTWFAMFYGVGTVALLRFTVHSANARLARDR